MTEPNKPEEEEAPSYVEAVDKIGAVLLRQVERGKALDEDKAQMLVRLAIVEQLDRVASALEALNQSAQVQAQSVNAYVYTIMHGTGKGNPVGTPNDQ